MRQKVLGERSRHLLFPLLSLYSSREQFRVSSQKIVTSGDEATPCHRNIFICGNTKETISHLCFRYVFASALWDHLTMFFGAQLPTNSSLLDLLRHFIVRDLGPQVWNLWWCRCSVAVFAYYAWCSIRKVSLIQHAWCHEKYNWCFSVASPLIGTRFCHLPRGSLKLIGKTPFPGWRKVNIDGDAFGAPALAGCASVLWISKARIKGCFCFPSRVPYAF